MTKVVLWSSSAGDITANLAFTNNFTATTNPGVGNDITQGYTSGSVWINQTTDEVFTCTDQTAGAALWQLTSTGSSTPGQVTAPAGSDAIVTGGAAATATSAGGKSKLVGAAGGATSGIGGEADVIGGAGTAGNSAGGPGKVTGGAGQGSAAGGEADLTGGAGGATGVGGAAKVTGGAGGATSGNGGQAQVTGGAGTAGNGNGGSVVLAGGTPNGSGVGGMVIERSVSLNFQPAQFNQNTAATLTAANLLTGIITSTPAGAINLQLPLATAMDTAIPDSIANDSFDFSLITLNTNIPTITTNTGWTLVGNMAPSSNATNGSARFRAQKTGAGAWTLFRLS